MSNSSYQSSPFLQAQNKSGLKLENSSGSSSLGMSPLLGNFNGRNGD